MNPEYPPGTCRGPESVHQVCQAIINEKGDICGETDSLEILDKVHKLYAKRIKDVEEDLAITEADRTCMKLQIMTEWIKDLGEQNTMLVHTVQDLEQAAAQRVKLLDRKLQQSSHLISEKMAQYNQPEEELKALFKKVYELEEEEKHLQQKVQYLQSDIRNLLELIRRAREENSWSLDNIKFYEIQSDDIPVPLDCHHSQEKGDARNILYNHSPVKQHVDEESFVVHQQELENDLLNANNRIEEQEKAIRDFVQKLHNSLKKTSKFSSETKFEPSFITDNLDFSIGSTTEIMENTYIMVDTEIQHLHQQLEKLVHEKECNENHIHIPLEEKCKQIRELEARLASVEKESVETRAVLAAEVAEKHDQTMALRNEITNLKDKCHLLHIQVQFKEDIIKEMRKELNHSSLRTSCSTRKVRISAHEENGEPSYNLSDELRDEILTCLCNIKADMEKEKNDIFELKERLQNTVKHLSEENEESEQINMKIVYEKLQDMEMLLQEYKTKVIEGSESSESAQQFFVLTEEKIVHLQNLLHKNPEAFNLYEKEKTVNILSTIVNYISTMHLEKEKFIAYLKNLMKRSNNPTENTNTVKNVSELLNEEIYNEMRQQFQQMEEFRICTVEAQAATEDLQEEAESVISIFSDCHQKYAELNIMVNQVRDCLLQSRQNICQEIHRLKLQEEERKRQNERIMYDTNKLKDIKNNINQVRAELSSSLHNIQGNIQTYGLETLSETQYCNNLLNTVEEEVDRIVSTLSVFQEQGGCIVNTLTELKDQFSTIECTLQNLQHKSNEICQENEITQKVFYQRQKKLQSLEEELDCAHTKMRYVLENILDKREKISQYGFVDEKEKASEEVKEYMKTKTELHKIRKDCEDLKIKLLEEQSKTKQYESIAEIKNKFSDAQSQVEFLKNEVKGKQEVNNILKLNIDSMEKELYLERTKAEAHKKICFEENVKLIQKIVQLEKNMQTYKNTKCDLKNNLVSNELKLKKLQDQRASTDFSLDGTSYKHGVKYEANEASPALLPVVDSINDASGKCDNSIEQYSHEIDDLKCALASKDKLLGNMDKIINIQTDSITMMQSEMKDVHKKLQEQVDMQDTIIAQHKEEKKKLLKQIELQTQTIGHLQNAVVEAKKCIDQMGHKAMSDNQNNKEIIQSLNIYLTEMQSQYSECFAEAAKQDTLLELQRSAVEYLRNEINNIKYCECILFILFYLTCYFIKHSLQEELQSRISECQHLKTKVEDLKNELEKYKTDIDLLKENLAKEKMKTSVITELQSKLNESKHKENCLKSDNENIRQLLDKYKEKEDKEKVSIISRESQTDFSNRQEMTTKQEQTITELTDKLLENESQMSKLLCELHECKENYATLKNNVCLLEKVLREKSLQLAKLQSDYQIIKNENSILRTEKNMIENNAQEEINKLKNKKNEIQLELYVTKDNCDRIIQDFHKNQELLIKATRREVDLQQLFVNKEKSLYAKIATTEKEEARQSDLINILTDEIQVLREELAAKNLELTEFHNNRKFLNVQLKNVHRDVYCLQQKVNEVEENNCFLQRQLKQCEKRNVMLSKQTMVLEQNNSRCRIQLESMHKSLLDIRQECQLKSKILAHISADLTQTAISRSELCNESHYVISCIREWMEDQKKMVHILGSKLKYKQQQYMRILGEKKELLIAVKELKYANNILVRQVRRFHRPLIRRAIRNTCNRCPHSEISQSPLTKKIPVRKIHKKCITGYSWWFPRLERITEELREYNKKQNHQNNIFFNQIKNDLEFDESRDCGYQSSVSK